MYAASEPSWVVPVIREILPKKKLVLDIHDAQVWRSSDPRYKSAEERLSFAWADSLVVPSDTCKKILEPKQPCLVLPPYVNDFCYQSRGWAWKGGIVYQGRVDLPSSKEFMSYSRYEELAKQLKDEIPLHIYMPGKEEDLKPWYDIYRPLCTFNKGLQYEAMLSALGFYDWGLCGNITKHQEWDVAMPNKLFDYMAGGIPIIALNCKEVAKFVKKHKVGIAVSSIQEIKDRWEEREQCQRNVFLKRFNFTMEKHIEKLSSFLQATV